MCVCMCVCVCVCVCVYVSECVAPDNVSLQNYNTTHEMCQFETALSFIM